MLTLIKITCCNTYAKNYQQSSQALNIRSAGYMGPRGVTRWGKGARFPGRRITMRAPNNCGALKSPNNVTSTVFNTLNLPSKDLRFKH